jgi:hypothetical protein
MRRQAIRTQTFNSIRSRPFLRLTIPAVCPSVSRLQAENQVYARPILNHDQNLANLTNLRSHHPLQYFFSSLFSKYNPSTNKVELKTRPCWLFFVCGNFSRSFMVDLISEPFRQRQARLPAARLPLKVWHLGFNIFWRKTRVGLLYAPTHDLIAIPLKNRKAIMNSIMFALRVIEWRRK